MQSSHSRRTDDHRIQEAICESGDRDLFPELEIPRSTLRSWIHRGIPDVLTCDPTTGDRAYLLAEIHRYQRRTALLGAIVGLLIAMLRVSRVRLDYERLPRRRHQESPVTSDRSCGEGLVAQRGTSNHTTIVVAISQWCFAETGCDLDDQSSCSTAREPICTQSSITPRGASCRGHSKIASAVEGLARSCAKPLLS